jgi:hypothetical protein
MASADWCIEGDGMGIGVSWRRVLCQAQESHLCLLPDIQVVYGISPANARCRRSYPPDTSKRITGRGRSEGIAAATVKDNGISLAELCHKVGKLRNGVRMNGIGF